MTRQDIDITTTEGKLLYASIMILKTEGPPEVKGKSFNEIINILDQTSDKLANFKM